MARIYLISLGDAHYSPGPSLPWLQSEPGEGSVQGSCSLTSFPIARERKVHHYPVLCATYLVRKPLWREGTTPPGEKKLFFQDDGCCSMTGRWLRGVRGSLASCGVFGMWFQSLAVHRAAVCRAQGVTWTCNDFSRTDLGL